MKKKKFNWNTPTGVFIATAISAICLIAMYVLSV